MPPRRRAGRLRALRGQGHLLANDFTRAAADLRRSVELCPTMPISRAAWGVALFKLATSDGLVRKTALPSPNAYGLERETKQGITAVLSLLALGENPRAVWCFCRCPSASLVASSTRTISLRKARMVPACTPESSAFSGQSWRGKGVNLAAATLSAVCRTAGVVFPAPERPFGRSVEACHGLFIV